MNETKDHVIVSTKDSDVIFVARAATKQYKGQDCRKWGNALHVENGKLYATDGRRLHFTETGMDDGEYEIVKCLKKEVQFRKLDNPDFQYPDVDRVIPERTGELVEQFDFKSWNNNHYTEACRLIKWIPDNAINLDFLSELYGDTWEISLHDKNRVLLATCRTRTAVIALMNLY